jgi:hypothetical protein
MRRFLYPGLVIGALAVGGAGMALWPAPILDEPTFRAQYVQPRAPLPAPLQVYHIGHSLVSRNMPAMLAQLVPGHDYASQLGWGTSIKNHLDGEVMGFDTENAHPKFRPMDEALADPGLDALVVTEMVEIRDAIKYHDSAKALGDVARMARKANPDLPVFLYETWHDRDDPDGWLARIDRDLALYWEGQILRPAMADEALGPIYVIPGGQVMAAIAREIEAGQIDGITDIAQLFALADDGSSDQIHPNDLGSYVIALTHYAVLYQKSPVGLPHALLRADGTPADAPSALAARQMQEVVWRVVTSYDATGVGQVPQG